MNWREFITVDPEVCHGQACLNGTRIPVAVILDNLAAKVPYDEIMKSYPGVKGDFITAAITYAADLARERVVAIQH